MLDLLSMIEDRCFYKLILLYPVQNYSQIFALIPVTTDSQVELEFFNVPSITASAENPASRNFLHLHTPCHTRQVLPLIIFEQRWI